MTKRLMDAITWLHQRFDLSYEQIFACPSTEKVQLVYQTDGLYVFRNAFWGYIDILGLTDSEKSALVGLLDQNYTLVRA